MDFWRFCQWRSLPREMPNCLACWRCVRQGVARDRRPTCSVRESRQEDGGDLEAGAGKSAMDAVESDTVGA